MIGGRLPNFDAVGELCNRGQAPHRGDSLNHGVPVRTRQIYFAKFSYNTCLGLGLAFGPAACSDGPTAAVAVPPIAQPKRTIICVRESPTGGAPEIVAPDAMGTCPDGFDTKVWQ
jgi:hypothetical protein